VRVRVSKRGGALGRVEHAHELKMSARTQIEVTGSDIEALLADAAGGPTKGKRKERKPLPKPDTAPIEGRTVGGAGDSDAEHDAEPSESTEKKVRFVWTAAMHHRFEEAVQQLGVAQAKPQAIRQLMGCEGEEDAPTRQNIKSHLQKYRQHRQTAAAHGSAAASAAAAAAASSASASSVTTSGTTCSDNASSATGRLGEAALEQYQVNLLQQVDVQAKLHEQLMLQRQAQEDLARWLSRSPTATMRSEQLTRLAQQVVFQRQLLQHLFALLQAHTEDVVRDGSWLATSMAKANKSRMPSPPVPVPHSFGYENFSDKPESFNLLSQGPHNSLKIPRHWPNPTHPPRPSSFVEWTTTSGSFLCSRGAGRTTPRLPQSLARCGG